MVLQGVFPLPGGQGGEKVGENGGKVVRCSMAWRDMAWRDMAWGAERNAQVGRISRWVWVQRQGVQGDDRHRQRTEDRGQMQGRTQQKF